MFDFLILSDTYERKMRNKPDTRAVHRKILSYLDVRGRFEGIKGVASIAPDKSKELFTVQNATLIRNAIKYLNAQPDYKRRLADLKGGPTRRVVRYLAQDGIRSWNDILRLAEARKMEVDLSSLPRNSNEDASKEKNTSQVTETKVDPEGVKGQLQSLAKDIDAIIQEKNKSEENNQILASKIGELEGELSHLEGKYRTLREDFKSLEELLEEELGRSEKLERLRLDEVRKMYPDISDILPMNFLENLLQNDGERKTRGERLPKYNEHYGKPVKYPHRARFLQYLGKVPCRDEEKVIEVIKNLAPPPHQKPGLRTKKYHPGTEYSPDGCLIVRTDREMRLTYTPNGESIKVHQFGHHTDFYSKER